MKQIPLLALLALMAIPARAQDADSAAYYIQRAGTAYTVKDYAASIAAYESAMRFRPDNPTVAFNIACDYSLLGDKKEALEWLSKAIDLGMYSFDGDSDMDNIRGTREYKKLLAKADRLLAKVKNMMAEPVVVLPEGYDPGRPYPLLLAMHGYGGEPQRFSRAFVKTCSRKGYILCCPYAPEVMGKAAFNWGDWAQAEKRIAESMAFMKGKYNIDEKRTIICGFSQGGYYTYYLGLRHPDLFRGGIAIAPSYHHELDSMLPAAAARGARFYVLLGELEPAERIAGNVEAAGLMAKSGISASFNFFTGVGHAFPGDADFELGRAIDWIEKY